MDFRRTVETSTSSRPSVINESVAYADDCGCRTIVNPEEIVECNEWVSTSSKAQGFSAIDVNASTREEQNKNYTRPKNLLITWEEKKHTPTTSSY
jgi:hypothetical protein